MEKARASELWRHIQWRKYLHYVPSLFYQAKSRADGDTFFTHPEGKYQPQLEMEELILRLTSKEKITNSHPRCLYPARVKWLQKQLGLHGEVIDFSKCEKYLDYRKKHNTKKVYLVFSSYYLESPASTFGHTLLRLAKEEKIKTSKQSELLDIAINFGANYTTSNPFIYSLLGITGGFRGSFSSLPYFYKIREYNDFESRDLWSYELNLSYEQIEVFLDHLWEMGNTYFDYYYFDENCSFYLLSLLEVVNPEWKLIENIPVYVLPVDTLKVVNRIPGLVGSVSYRPSIRSRANTYINELNTKEKRIFNQIVESRDLNLIKHRLSSEKERAYVADALTTYIDLKYPKEVLNEKGDNYNWKMKLLSLRSGVDHMGITATPARPNAEVPHTGHDTARANISYSYHDKLRSAYLLSYRFALHDLLDSRQGHSKTSSIEFLHARLKYYEYLDKIRLDKFTLVQIANLNPWTAIQKSLSIKLNFGFRSADEVLCDLCVVPNLDYAFGSTHYLDSSHRTMLSVLLAGEFTYSTKYKTKGLAIGIGPMLNLYRWWGEAATTRLSLSYFHFVNQGVYQNTLIHETRFHLNKDYDIIISNSLKKASHEHTVGLSYFH